MTNIAAANGKVYGFHSAVYDSPTALTVLDGEKQTVVRSGDGWAGSNSGANAGGYVESLDALLIFEAREAVFLYFLANDTKVDVAYVDNTGGAIELTNGGRGMYVQDMDNIYIAQQRCGCGCQQ